MITDDVVVERDLTARMRDGTILRADVYRPARGGPYPALVLRTPYDKAIAQTSAYAHRAWYARHGYVVVVQDVRGRFRSDGTFVPFASEAEDGNDTVRWAAQLTGTTGQVALYGFSYAGVAGYMAAAETPPELCCAALACASPDLCDGWIYRGGALQLAFALHWFVDLLAIPEAEARGLRGRAQGLVGIVSDLQRRSLREPLITLAAEHLDELQPLLAWLPAEPHCSGLLCPPLRDLERIRIPILNIGGWFDCFAKGTVASHETIITNAPDSRLIMGPWFHAPWTQLVGERDFGVSAVSKVDHWQLAWFDWWLKSEGSPAGGLPRARVFVMGSQEWHDLHDWPPAGVSEQTWFLHSDGGAAHAADGKLDVQEPGDEIPDVFVFEPRNPVPTHGGTWLGVDEATSAGVREQSIIAARTDVAVYTSPALSDDLEILGTASLLLFAATDAASSDWVAKIVDVHPGGQSFNVCDGIQRVVRRKATEMSQLVVPGEPYECEIRFAPTAHRFKAGHQVRLHLANSDFPQFDVNCGNGSQSGGGIPSYARRVTQVIYHQTSRESRLVLPTTNKVLGEEYVPTSV